MVRGCFATPTHPSPSLKGGVSFKIMYERVDHRSATRVPDQCQGNRAVTRLFKGDAVQGIGVRSGGEGQ